MKILYANVIEANAGWGAEVSMSRELVTAGYTVENLDYRVNRNRLSRVFGHVKNFDLFFLQRGDHFPVILVKAIERPKVFFFSELVSVRNDADELFRSNLFDHYLVRGEYCRQELIRRGWVPSEKISVMLSAFDPSVYYPDPLATKDLDILFVGTPSQRRKLILDQLNKEFRVTVTSAFGHDASVLFNSAKIVLNLHATDELDTETRIYEALGAGAFVVTEKLAQESPFINGADLIEVNSLADLPDVLRHYLASQDEREKIALHGHTTARQDHTYRVRVKQLSELFARFETSSYQGPPTDLRQLMVVGVQEKLNNGIMWSKRRIRQMIGS